MNSEYKGVIIVTNHFTEFPVNPKIVYANRNFQSLTKFSLNELLEKDPTFIFNNWNNEEFIGQIVECVENNQPWRGVLHIKDRNGKILEKEFLINPISNINGEVSYYSCTTILESTDIDVVYEAPRSLDNFINDLWAFQEHFKDVYEMSPACLLKIDDEGIITYANASAQNNYGFKLNDNLFDLIPENQIYTKKFFKNKQVIGKVSKIDFDLFINEKRWSVYCRFWPLTNEQGLVSGYSIYLKDISKKKETLKQLLALKEI